MWGCIDMPQRRKKTYEGGREYINADKYTTILEDNIWPVIVRHFPGNNYLFHDDNAHEHRAIYLSMVLT